MSWPSHEFKEGDIVHLRTGHARQRVIKTRPHTIRTQYLSETYPGQYPRKFRAAADYILITQSEEDTMTNKPTLFKTKDDQYGTLLTKDSQGRYVLELKGSNKVDAFDPKDLEEVMPYTVEIHDNRGGTHHYEVTEGSLEIGDVILFDNLAMGQVQKLNTKCHKTQPSGNLRKVGTSEVK